jgi:hypothetical protein
MTPLTIKISTAGGGTPFLRQLPKLHPLWQNCQFFINTEPTECDLWVVYGGLGKVETTCTSATLLITNEPSSVKTYRKRFTDQFDAVLTCQKISHPHVIHSQQALPWWVGHKMKADGSDDVRFEKTYDELSTLPTPPKTKLLSIIVSNKQFTKGHKQRYDFAQFLKRELGDQIDMFGIDKPLEDKWDAIAPYKYHIVIENSATDDYWTEKLADAFLGESYPIYYGAPNIEKYFSPDMLSTIDITKPHEALRTITSLIARDQYEQSVAALVHTKQLILNTYQLFPVLAAYANSLPHVDTKVLTTLAPESESSIVKGIKRVCKTVLSFFLRK